MIIYAHIHLHHVKKADGIKNKLHCLSLTHVCTKSIYDNYKKKMLIHIKAKPVAGKAGAGGGTAFARSNAALLARILGVGPGNSMCLWIEGLSKSWNMFHKPVDY